jgi:malate dehydrogenase (oxaloacetate-decarboxylating)(NADP+)
MSQTPPTGYALLRNPRLNRGTAFTLEERRAAGIEGLLPPVSLTLELQVARIQTELSHLDNDLQKYLLLSDLQARTETLFYAVLMSDPARFMPIVYTPTVGEACQRFDHFFRASRGLYLPITARGRLREIMGNWPEWDVRFIVATDGGTHSGPRRPRGRRHGHPDRQAGALHGLRRRAAASLPAGDAGCWHQQ